MNKAEYWLLDSVVEYRIPLEFLIGEDLELTLNRRNHNLSYSELVNTLHYLFRDRDLMAIRKGKSDSYDEFIPTQEEVEAGLKGQMTIYYGLTVQGGARWESVSKPNWYRYIDASNADGEGEIIARDQYWVEQHLAMQSCLGWNVVEGTVQWDMLSPWSATYWKTLSIGHRVRFHYTDEPALDTEARMKGNQWLHTINGWYTKYIE